MKNCLPNKYQRDKAKQNAYNILMNQKYQKNIENGCLEINSCEQLRNLTFINKFNVWKLSIDQCPDVEPELSNNNIRELAIQCCQLLTIDGLVLKNLEVLNVSGNKIGIIKKINGFKRLKYLNLSGMQSKSVIQILWKISYN
ncbi:Leucine_rich repeat 4 [Hexamita inflata]|uniref:Leucine_rich repeat 4 n=1 Tax=Hexamita inflata TaxID=28002 RepID=A0ABP1H8G0_9EUKA